MYRKIVWCYVFILTLLDISLKTKLTAQGKSHGVSVHDSLVEGVTYQEWGTDSSSDSEAAGGVSTLSLSPPSLNFGRAALATPHVLTVTLTNTGNSTLHLASVAGTTPHFHASFFESKSLSPGANTSFTVVYLGRSVGLVNAQLFIHTSRGVHRYSVSAEGIPSEYEVWPLLGLRVPQNATYEPLLTMYNPTDQPIQVREVYSSASWLRLQLPGGERRAGGQLWRLPPRQSRPLVKLSIAPVKPGPSTAYIRIKTDAGAALCVPVEAQRAPPGEYALPPQLRARGGSRDPPRQMEISVGNSASTGRAAHAQVCGACAAQLHDGDSERHNSCNSEGVRVTMLRTELPPHLEPTVMAHLTFDHRKLWSSYLASLSNPANENGAATSDGKDAISGVKTATVDGKPAILDGKGTATDSKGVTSDGKGAINDGVAINNSVWCSGWVKIGSATVPYSIKLRKGTMYWEPNLLHFITASDEAALAPREFTVRNQFSEPLLVYAREYSDEVYQYFVTDTFKPLVIPPHGAASLGSLRPRTPALAPAHAHATVRTSLAAYTVPVALTSSRIDLEFDWPNSTSILDLGVICSGCEVHAALLVRGGGPWRAHSDLAGARLQPYTECAGHPASLYVRGGRMRGALVGRVHARTQHASTSRIVKVRTRDGRVNIAHVDLVAAPYAWGQADIVAHSSMKLHMRVRSYTNTQGHSELQIELANKSAITLGTSTIGRILYKPELACEPHCYTGLDLNTPEGQSWLRGAGLGAGLAREAAAARERVALFKSAKLNKPFSLYLHTDHMKQIPLTGSVRLTWPTLASPPAPFPPTTAGDAAPRTVLVRGPAAAALLLQVVLPSRGQEIALDDEQVPPCASSDTCHYSPSPFSITAWQALRGNVSVYPGGEGPPGGGGGGTPLLLLSPGAEVQVTVTFAPTAPGVYMTHLFLRNNLTILERVPVRGRGEALRLVLGGLPPGAAQPIQLEVTECTGSSGGRARRTVTLQNAGGAAVAAGAWSVAGAGCGARGLRLAPCPAAPSLRPGQRQALTISFWSDGSLSLVRAPLTLQVGDTLLRWTLAVRVPGALLPRCRPAPRAPPPHAPAAAAAALLLVLCVGAIDAERLLRRARSARPAPPRAAPLDLRCLAPPPPPPLAPPPPPLKQKRRKRRDRSAERRAFERWQRQVTRGENSSDTDQNNVQDEDQEDVYENGNEGETYEAEQEEESPPQTPDEDAPSSECSSSSPDEAGERGERDERGERGERGEREASGAGGGAGGGGGDVVEQGHVDEQVRRRRPRRDSTPRRPAPRAPRPPPRRAAPPAPRRPRAPPPPPRPPPLRWGASWSDVVAAKNTVIQQPTLAPIGSDVRRRAPAPPPPPAPPPAPAPPAPRAPPLADNNSLFYYNGEGREEFAWRAHAREYIEEAPSNAYVRHSGVWGSPAAPWPWAPLRPPPGFPAPPRPERAYDPFRSLAALWAPGGAPAGRPRERDELPH